MGGFVAHASTELAIQLLKEGRFDECIACMDQVIQTNPDDALAYSILGAAYSQIGDHGMAIAAFERSLAEEDSARGHFNLGKAYEEAGRIQNALDEYRMASEADPAYSHAADALERLNVLLEESKASTEEIYKPHLLGGDES
jgi:tetratricopeptide (TPR) repeat protein